MSTNQSETTLPSESTGHEEYNGGGFPILGPLWRRKYLVAAFCAVGVLAASIVAICIANRYTSDVVIQARFVRQEPQLQSEISLDAASVIQTELSLIRSRDIAEDVVTRLGLANDPNFVEDSSLLDRALDSITFWHSRLSSPSSSATSLIAAKLLKNLDVTNDARSLLIRISYTSTSPEQSARIANAFAEEYLRTRKETTARRQLTDLAATYGPKHPSVLKAQAQLEDALRAPSVTDSAPDSAQILAWALPPILPSGPDRRLIVAVAFICSFAAGIVFVLILERANTSFRSDAALAVEAKMPCLGMFAEGSSSSDFEAARAIVMAAGFSTQSPQSKILLVTCSVPEEGASLVSTTIARSLVQMGRRALILDLSPEALKTSKSIRLESVLDRLEHHALILDGQLTEMHSAFRSCKNQSVITSCTFTRFLEQAREQCDLLIIAAPPVMTSADALYLGRQADFVLHVVRWNFTPRRAVLAALDRLRNFGIPVDGVILARVHEKEFWRLTGVAVKSQRKMSKDWKTLAQDDAAALLEA